MINAKTMRKSTANDPRTWHKDTVDVFKIVGSRFKDQTLGISFLNDVKPFERARICSGLRDLIAMDIFETDMTDDGLVLIISNNFDTAKDAYNIDTTVDISHLKQPKLRR